MRDRCLGQSRLGGQACEFCRAHLASAEIFTQVVEYLGAKGRCERDTMKRQGRAGLREFVPCSGTDEGNKR